MKTLVITLVSGLILLIIGQRIKIAYKKRDKLDAQIREIVETYRANAHSHPPKTSGFNGLIQAGIFMLLDDSNIREVCKKIKAYGDPSPLGKYEEMLRDVNLHWFFALAKERKYDFLSKGNPVEIVQELKKKQLR